MRISAAILLLLGLTPALAQDVAQGPKDVAPTPKEAAATTQAEQQAPAQSSPAAPPVVDKGDGPVERPVVCYSAREASDRIARLRLFNPLVAMQANARRARAEPLRLRLCRSGGRLVYELALIRRDGKVLRLYLNAHTGRQIASPRN